VAFTLSQDVDDLGASTVGEGFGHLSETVEQGVLGRSVSQLCTS
jgi:hypothetical protein